MIESARIGLVEEKSQSKCQIKNSLRNELNTTPAAAYGNVGPTEVQLSPLSSDTSTVRPIVYSRPSGICWITLSATGEAKPDDFTEVHVAPRSVLRTKEPLSVNQ